jgi:predicted dehydrogenase
MKVLVIGLGSMGKRRIRNLKSLGIDNIAGFDVRSDRLQEATLKYEIQPFSSFSEALDVFTPSIAVISVSPDSHTGYIESCIASGINCFIEASVTDKDDIFRLSSIAENSRLVIAPSCTMLYYPGPAKIKELVNSKKYGRVINFTYHSGQYLPDWHPWEDISEFYVSKRETGGCREIVPFELTWLNDIFGYPEVVSSTKTKLSDIEADIDDIYQISLCYPGRVLGSLIVDVIARPKARREMFINLERGQIVFSSHENCIRHIGIDSNQWEIENLPSGTIENMYINPEEPYIRELDNFLKACQQEEPRLFPNSLLRDWTVLNLLSRIDNRSITF